MEMFTLKRFDSALLASCRACGHEQSLPTPADSHENDAGINIRCERCPSEEAYVAIPEAGAQTGVA